MQGIDQENCPLFTLNLSSPPRPLQVAVCSTGQPYGRVFNFSAGPACLPIEVLEQAQADMLNWNGSGESRELSACL